MPTTALTGQAAIAHSQKVKDTELEVHFSSVVWWVLELRARMFAPLGRREQYFHVRHRYTPHERRLLDMLVIFEGRYTDPIRKYRRNRLIQQYKSELELTLWHPIPAPEDSPVYVWYEDIDPSQRPKCYLEP